MTVTSCNIAGTNITSRSDERGRYTHTLEYEIESNAVQAPPQIEAEARALAPGTNDPLPAWGAPYFFRGYTDNGSFAKDFQTRLVDDDNPRYWRTTVTYMPLEPAQTAADFNVDPTLRPTKLWWEVRRFPVQLTSDVQGAPLVNKAGMAYVETIEEQLSMAVLVARWNVATDADVYDLITKFDGYINSVNWQPFGPTGPTVAPRKALCEVEPGPLMTEINATNNTTYYPVTLRFSIKPNSIAGTDPVGEYTEWVRSIVEQGYYTRQKDAAGNLIEKDNPTNAQAPVGKVYDLFKTESGDLELLAADGTLLENGVKGISTDWRVKFETDFSQLASP